MIILPQNSCYTSLRACVHDNAIDRTYNSMNKEW